MKLGTLLLRDGVINLDQLETALRQQVLFGGKLGSNLVELGYVSLDTLAVYLGRIFGVPAATKERLEAADPAAIVLIPARLAAAHSAFPFAFEDNGGTRKLAVAMVDPRDRAGIEAMREAAGMPIQPYIAGELRVFDYLERHYGVKKSSALFAAVARVPPAMRRAPTPPPVPGPAHRLEIPPRPRTPTPVSFDAAAPTSAPVSLAETMRRLDEARARDEIGDAIVRFCRGRCAGAILFVVKDRLAIGWKGIVRDGTLERPEELVVPLSSPPSFLSTAFQTVRPWRGTPALDVSVARALGIDARVEDALVAPIAIGARVVHLLYAHGGPLDALAESILPLADAVAAAYARLIQAAKK